MIFKNSKVYDTLKYLALIAIPAISFFLSTIGEIWGLGWMPKVVATVSAVATLLGALIQVSKMKFTQKEDSDDGNEETDG